MRELSQTPNAIYLRNWQEKHKQTGLCTLCNRPTANNRKYCLFHLSIRSHIHRKYYATHRVEQAFADKTRYYKLKSENKCVFCGMLLNEESRMGVRCLNCYITHKMGR